MAPERPVERKHRECPDQRELRDEDHAVRLERLRHERREHEGRERAGRILEGEVAVRDEPVGDPFSVRPVERDVRHRVAEQLPRDSRDRGDRDEDGGCHERRGRRTHAHAR